LVGLKKDLREDAVTIAEMRKKGTSFVDPRQVRDKTNIHNTSLDWDVKAFGNGI